MLTIRGGVGGVLLDPADLALRERVRSIGIFRKLDTEPLEPVKSIGCFLVPGVITIGRPRGSLA